MSRNQLQQIKKNMDDGRDQLIKNLEDKVQSLKLERELLFKREQLRRAQQKVGRPVPEEGMQPWQLKQAIEQNKERGQQLEVMYNQQINRTHKAALGLFESDKGSQRKRRIVDEEMKKVKELLGKNKTVKAADSNPALVYEEILKTKQGELEARRFKDTLKKQKLSKMEQEYLLESVFKVLQSEKELVSKDALKRSLPHNQRFCEIFCIGKRQIKHDLEVCDCKEPEGLSYREFYELVKSIQLTSFPKYKPKPVQAAPIKSAPKPEKVISAAEKDKLLRSYLKHVFEMVDKKQEFIVLRLSMATAIQKGSYLNKEFEGKVDKAFLKDFGRHFQQVGEVETEYYKKLSKEYVSYNETIREYEWFIRHYMLPPKQPPSSTCEREEPKNINNQEQSEISASEGPIEPLPNDNEQPFEYESHPSQEEPADLREPVITADSVKDQLSTFDQHYKQLQEQYHEQIVKDELDRDQIKKELSDLENYIGYLQLQQRH